MLLFLFEKRSYFFILVTLSTFWLNLLKNLREFWGGIFKELFPGTLNLAGI